MAWNGAGTFVRLYSWVTDAANGIFVRADRMDADSDDIASGISNCIAKDGQNAAIANLPMGGYKHTAWGGATSTNATVTDSGTLTFTATTAINMTGSGQVLVPTATAGDNSTKAASTAFVQATAFAAALPSISAGVTDYFTTNNGTIGSWSNLLKAGTIRFADSTDTTKRLAFDVSGVTTGTTRTVTIPNSSGTMVYQGAITTSGMTQATAKLLGRTTAGTGAIEELSVSGATLSSGTLTITPTAASGASLVLLSTVTASNSATVDIETTFDSTYDEYLITITSLIPATDNTSLYCRLKMGGSYDSTGGNYQFHYSAPTSGASTYSGQSRGTGSGVTEIWIAESIDNTTASHSLNLDLRVSNPASTSVKKLISWKGAFIDNGGNLVHLSGAGHNTQTSACTGIRFFMSSGNITSGTFRLYGLKKS